MIEYTIILVIASVMLGFLLKEYIFDFFNLGEKSEKNESSTNGENTNTQQKDNVTTEDMILHDMVNEEDEWDIGEVNFND